MTAIRRLDTISQLALSIDDSGCNAEWLIARVFAQLRDVGRPDDIHLHYWFSKTARLFLDEAIQDENLMAHREDLRSLRVHVGDMIAIGINLRKHGVDHALAAWRVEYDRHHAGSEPSDGQVLLEALKLTLLGLMYGRGAGLDAGMQLMAEADGIGGQASVHLERRLREAFMKSTRLVDGVQRTEEDHEDSSGV